MQFIEEDTHTRKQTDAVREKRDCNLLKKTHIHVNRQIQAQSRENVIHTRRQTDKFMTDQMTIGRYYCYD